MRKSIWQKQTTNMTTSRTTEKTTDKTAVQILKFYLREASCSRRRSFACSSAIHFSNCSTSLSSLEWSGLRELEKRANTSLLFSICLNSCEITRMTNLRCQIGTQIK